MSERRWVIVLRGVEDATPTQLALAAVRARTALKLSCDSTLTLEESLFDDITARAGATVDLRRLREAA